MLGTPVFSAERFLMLGAKFGRDSLNGVTKLVGVPQITGSNVSLAFHSNAFKGHRAALWFNCSESEWTDMATDTSIKNAANQIRPRTKSPSSPSERSPWRETRAKVREKEGDWDVGLK